MDTTPDVATFPPLSPEAAARIDGDVIRGGHLLVDAMIAESTGDAAALARARAGLVELAIVQPGIEISICHRLAGKFVSSFPSASWAEAEGAWHTDWMRIAGRMAALLVAEPMGRA